MPLNAVSIANDCLAHLGSGHIVRAGLDLGRQLLDARGTVGGQTIQRTGWPRDLNTVGACGIRTDAPRVGTGTTGGNRLTSFTATGNSGLSFSA